MRSLEEDMNKDIKKDRNKDRKKDRKKDRNIHTKVLASKVPKSQALREFWESLRDVEEETC